MSLLETLLREVIPKSGPVDAILYQNGYIKKGLYAQLFRQRENRLIFPYSQNKMLKLK